MEKNGYFIYINEYKASRYRTFSKYILIKVSKFFVIYSLVDYLYNHTDNSYKNC